MTTYTCPVCGNPDLDEPPYNGRLPSLEYCPCCGFQFGWTDDDRHISHDEWREQWIKENMPWDNPEIPPPDGWDPSKQLLNIDVVVPPHDPQARDTAILTCPVCGYPDLSQPAYRGNEHSKIPSFKSCPCCGFQFGWTEKRQNISHEQWRKKWINDGMIWDEGRTKAPPDWDPCKQLLNIGIAVT